jgi:hypothetical protein
LANLLADLERDEQAGVETLATRLGPARTWRLASSLLALVLALQAAAPQKVTLPPTYKKWLEEEAQSKAKKGFCDLLKPVRFGRGTEHSSENVDELVYGGKQ